MNNLIISLLMLMIIIGVGGILIEKMNNITSQENIERNIISTYHISIYRLYNDTYNVLMILNYGDKQVILRKIICLNIYTSEEMFLNDSQIVIEPHEMMFIYINVSSKDLMCIIYGDKWSIEA